MGTAPIITGQRKQISPAGLKLDEAREGQFRAIFSTFNVVDLDGDVTIPGAFTSGQAVRLAQWGHNWGALPVGRGVIDQDDEKAWVDGQFLLSTQAGRDTWETVKDLAELQEWSYGFDITKWSMGEFGEAKEQVRFLEGLSVVEVSPVMLGAGIDTRTEAIKALGGAQGSLADQAALVLAANADLSARLRSLAELRATENRGLSEENRKRILAHAQDASGIAQELMGLYEATQPAPVTVTGHQARQAGLAAIRLEVEALAGFSR